MIPMGAVNASILPFLPAPMKWWTPMLKARRERHISRVDPDDFWSKVVREDADDCWPWMSYVRPDGYGQYGSHRCTWQAHRVAYMLLVGPIPDGLQIDHLCHNRSCVNPRHMEPVTPQTNTLRGEGPAAQQIRRTHCPRGHLYSGDNLYIASNGGRCCRACGRIHARNYRKRKLNG